MLAFIIAGLGIFAWAAYLSERRMKEMSIRKILGATILHIIDLLSKDFLKLVVIAILIASPIAWISMNHWLNDFAFQINLQWWVFVGAGLATIVIAIGTVSIRISLAEHSIHPIPCPVFYGPLYTPREATGIYTYLTRKAQETLYSSLSFLDITAGQNGDGSLKTYLGGSYTPNRYL